MRDTELSTLINRLRDNNAIVFRLALIYNVITGGAVVTLEDFNRWFHTHVVELKLIEDIHFMYREPDDVDTVFVKGHVGLVMLLQAENVIGEYARQEIERSGFAVRTMITYLLSR